MLERGDEQARLQPGRTFCVALGATASEIRRLRGEDEGRRFCIYDTALEDDVSHADVCQTRGGGRGEQTTTHRKPACEDLMETGPMTRRLARFCNLEPGFVTLQFRRYVGQDRRTQLAA